ncbi:MAG: sulfonate ABC transporter substrate-binding protein, partial [Alphaproteobacteria bacterium]|nr:sulfonate ABC transporter substrate-binding protein [Alphaproteobacteria bacterium]
MILPPKGLSRRRLLKGGVLTLGAAALARTVIRPARAETPLRIGIQKGGSLFMLRERGQLPKVLSPLGFAPTFTEFPGGPQLL